MQTYSITTESIRPGAGRDSENGVAAAPFLSRLRALLPAAKRRATLAAVVLVAGVFAAASAGAQEHRLWVGLDLDRDRDTGCTLAGGDYSGDQVVSGLEWSVEIAVDPDAEVPSVISMLGSNCEAGDTVASPTWGPQSEDVSTDWSVGIDLGEVAGDVVELRVETSALGISGPVRLVTLSESAGGHRDTLLTIDGTSGGPDILFPAVTAVPGLSGLSQVVLVLAFCLLAIALIRRPIPGLPIWIAVIAIGTARISWALTMSLDGAIGEWFGVSALATDMLEDSETNDPSADLLALFAAWDGDDIALRIDVGDLEPDLCEHDGTTCHFVDPDGSESIADAVSNLENGDRIVVRAGTYRETEWIKIAKDGVHMVGEGNVTIHNTIDDLSWVVHDVASNVYRSENTYANAGQSRAWGYFAFDQSDPEAEPVSLMLLSYPCYEALAAGHSNYPAGETISCEDLPYIGPGLFWDVAGSITEDANGAELEPGHIYVRMRASASGTGDSPQFTAVALANDWSIPADPNETSMTLTVDGPWLQLNANDVRVTNLKLELGSIRMGGGSFGNELNNLVIDGPSYEGPIEFYSGGSHHLLDGIDINQKFPNYVSWQDSKELFKSSLMYAAITLNKSDPPLYEYPINNITLRNSRISNVHDGMEVNQDAYHHLYIVGNIFENVQDDGIQLASSTYDVEIAGNRFERVATSVSRHGAGANAYPGRKYIHHNFIDASTPKYYCRENADGTHCSDSVSSDGSQTLRAFGLHDNTSYADDGDPRYIYNNTVVVNGDILGVGLHGQGTDSLPYGQPSLILNNVFVQLDDNYPSTTQSPKWAIMAPATLILDGNLYYRPANAAATRGPFEMSGKNCDFDFYRDELCIPISENYPEGWTPQLMDAWPYASAVYSWGIEDNGLFDDSDLELTSYIPSCSWLSEQVDPDTGEVIEAVDLTAIDGAYNVRVDAASEPVWTLEVGPPLPGVDGRYRGDTTCTPDPETPE